MLRFTCTAGEEAGNPISGSGPPHGLTTLFSSSSPRNTDASLDDPSAMPNLVLNTLGLDDDSDDEVCSGYRVSHYVPSTEPHAAPERSTTTPQGVSSKAASHASHSHQPSLCSPPPYAPPAGGPTTPSTRIGSINLELLDPLPANAVIDPRTSVPLIPVSSASSATLEEMLCAQAPIGVVESVTYSSVLMWFAAANPQMHAVFQASLHPLWSEGSPFPVSGAAPSGDSPHSAASNSGECSHVFVGQLPSFMTAEWIHMVLEYLTNAPGALRHVTIIPCSSRSSSPYGMVSLNHEAMAETIRSLDGRVFMCRNRVFFTSRLELRGIFAVTLARVIGIDAERPSVSRDEQLAHTALVLSAAHPPRRQASDQTRGFQRRVSGGSRRSSDAMQLTPTSSSVKGTSPPPYTGGMYGFPAVFPGAPIPAQQAFCSASPAYVPCCFFVPTVCDGPPVMLQDLPPQYIPQPLPPVAMDSCGTEGTNP